MGKKNSNISILVAEDDPFMQRVVKGNLEELGCNYDLVDNGAEAVKKYLNNSYDMILMDCEMPVMDGYKATEIIRKFEKKKYEGSGHKPIPIIAFTAGKSGENQKQKCSDAGMSCYVPKETGYGTLLDILEKYSSR